MKIAVIGSGISGLSSAWLLHKAHDVTLFEKNDYLGGHSNTINVEEDGRELPIDTGFIVYNPLNYPNLVELFAQLKVPTTHSDMSFSASMNNGRFEYSGGDANGIFAQRQNLLNPSYWRMLFDLTRFYRASKKRQGQIDDNLSLREYLDQHKFGKLFIDAHVLPMCAAIWSTPAEKMLDFPAKQFVDFFTNHGLFNLTSRPQWMTVNGGSKEYVKRIQTEIKTCVRLNSAVHKVTRSDDKVTITTTNQQQHVFDHVIFASHADQTLAMIDSPSELEHQLLSQFKYSLNHAYLHTDKSLMPKSKRAWASWNYIGNFDKNNHDPLSLTYWMNKLQPIDSDKDYFVSLNPSTPPTEKKLIRHLRYHHPILDQDAFNAQEELWSIQGKNRFWFCGSYWGYGFHEDGLQSGLAAAELLGGIKRPWKFDTSGCRLPVSNNPIGVTAANA